MAGEAPHQAAARVNAEKLTDAAMGDARVFMVLGDLIVPVPAERETLIGRDNRACDIVIADPRVSKKHASVYNSGDCFFIEDLGSLNGTTVNDESVEGAFLLANGDAITLPPYTMIFATTQHPRIAQMRQARTPEPASGNGGSHFAGQLNILSITDLIQLLNTTKQSGVLTFRYTGNDPASVFFHTGEILQARYRDLLGEEAVYRILGMNEGGFEFVQCAPPIPADPVRKPTLTLLLDGCRLMDESTQGLGSDPRAQVSGPGPLILEPPASGSLFEPSRLSPAHF